ncbi:MULTISPECIES: Cof-type HAD-IIB family hydrolase [unclassified Enterococcus]|uniref:Cof-type HAD-IIB family hydrolase n=1 Tax=unclassified Enterococcus TaxID=2608891 RepID=UPI001553B66D|nr:MULTISPECIES: Cof-type HAD-IIB family hydrolase [unclassified Enterococcus]MBS7576933.1 HAD family hydrolase [Enterococcus sp. MMGLQ5-2]MBS7584340.1 HAD family hydrolase [Enterococcus sp. MMGLQ5-1]NPD12196.1 HAD family hydrolase [Enterococcus sp. MMGLQ5-1]NPD36768.1 HAD family hydrolase [Enterococcus sp. MMGLQ5-2]
MVIKMIVVDMDGTFLNDNKQYNHDRFNRLFKKMEALKIRFVVASGNQYFQLRSFFPDIYQSITFIAENGANIVIGDQSFYNASLAKMTVTNTLNLLQDLQPINLIVCGKNSAYILEGSTNEQLDVAKFYYPKIKVLASWENLYNEKDDILKFALSFNDKDITTKLKILKNVLGNTLIPVSSGHGDIDLIVPGIHKYHGLQLLSKEWQISEDEIAAFGDSGNDFEMIKYIKHSFAMENAQTEIKQVAKETIGSNNSESLLDIIEKIINEAIKCAH